MTRPSQAKLIHRKRYGIFEDQMESATDGLDAAEDDGPY